MATIEITIPDTALTRVIDGISVQYGYTDTIEDTEGNSIPNPETKGQFVKRQMIRWAKESFKAGEVKQTVEAARTAAIADAEGIDIT